MGPDHLLRDELCCECAGGDILSAPMGHDRGQTGSPQTLLSGHGGPGVRPRLVRFSIVFLVVEPWKALPLAGCCSGSRNFCLQRSYDAAIATFGTDRRLYLDAPRILGNR